MTIKTTCLNRDQINIIGEDFGCYDKKGRTIGSQAFLGWAEYAPVKPAQMAQLGGYGYGSRAPGFYFTARVQPTRDGVCFGASQPVRYFGTEEEARAHIAKAMRQSRNRYLTKVAKGTV